MINLSLGGPSTSAAEQDAIAYAIASDVVVVAATGNSGDEQLIYPAALPNVIGVGALTPGRGLASFSTTGSHVDVVAPGVEVWSTTAPDLNAGLSYDAWDGTSMAAPHAAGVVALIRAANPGFTQAQVAARLTATAIDYGAPGYDTSFGYGAIDAYRALTNGSDPAGDYFEIEIEHTFIGDLSVGVGHSESAVQTLFLPKFNYFDDNDIHVRYSLPETSLAAVPGTWILGAADSYVAFSGSIVGFRIRSEGVNYAYTGTPVAIPDGTGELVSVGGTIPEADSTLSALAISDGPLGPSFDPATTAYTASVANSVESIDLTATTSDVDATLEVDGAAATSGDPVNVPLSVGENAIDLVVTAEDTINQTSYTVTVTRELPVTDPDLSTVDAFAPSVEANGVASTTVTVTLLDVLSNPLVGHNVTLSQAGGSSTISGGGTGTTNGSGQVAFSVSNTTVETVTYDATDTTDGVDLVDTAEVEFTPIVSDPDNSTVNATNTPAAANGVAFATVTITLLDSLGNPVPGHNVSLEQNGGTSDVSDSGAGTSDDDGKVSFNVTNTTAQTVIYDATDDTDGIAIIDTAEVVFTTPVTDAATSTVVATDPTVVADTVESTTITVTLLDADDEPLVGHDVTLSQAGGSSTISDGGVGATDGSGQVAFSVSSDTVETVTYTATDDTDGVGVTQTAQVEFTPLPTDADESTVAVSGDTAIPADGVTTTTITVTLENELGAPIVGHSVSLDQGGGNSTITGGGTTNGSGQTVFTVKNTVQEFVTYAATDDTDAVTVTQTAQVEFTAVPSDADQSSLAAAAPTLLANGVGNTTVTVTLRNALGNPVGGHSVTLDQDGSASISSGGTLVTDADGHAIFTVSNTTIETVTFNATDTSSSVAVTQTAQVDFIEPTTDASQSTVVAAAPVVEADGADTTTVTVTLRDADGAPLEDHDLTVTQGGGSSTISSAGTGTTNGAGRVTFTVSNATIENVSYSATDDTDGVAVTQTANVRFLIADQDASLSALTLNPGTLAPNFAPATTSYAASVANEVNSIDVTPTATQPGASLTVNGDTATSGAPVEIPLAVGGNAVEIVVTAPDDTTTATYTLTINRVSPPAPRIFIPPPPPPRLRVDLTLTNDDGGTATLEDFTILVDDETELTNGEAAQLTFGVRLVTLQGPTAFYSVEFGTACSQDGTVILLGGLAICTVHLDDQPIALVLSAPLDGATPLIDEALSLTGDAFDRDGASYVEASSAGTPPAVTVSVPVDAIPGGDSITIRVSPANEFAIGQNPPPGSLLVGGTGYVVEILDGDGNPIEDFAAPLELSFLLPDGAGPVDAYYFDPDLGLWVLEPSATNGNRIQLSPNHLTTFALFQIPPDGGLNGTPPARGIWLTTAEGGSVQQLRLALLDAGATGAFITHLGGWITYLPDAPDFVNQEFSDFFSAGIPQGQLLLISVGN